MLRPERQPFDKAASLQGGHASAVSPEAAAALSAVHASGSFYVTGGTVPLSSASYVVRGADDDLFHALSAGEYCYVLNTRQMGKSSLMVRTARRLRDELRAAVAVLDLAQVGQNLSPEQWYDGLLVSLGEQTGLEDELDDYWQENKRLGPLQRFLSAVRHVALPRAPGGLFVFVDEIDAVRSLPFPTDEFFAGIRECHNRRAADPEYQRLAFCLLGVATPADLVADPRISPFNIGRRIVLTDFTEEEAAPLAWGFGVPSGGDRLLRRVLHWTGGHPYLTQRLCRTLSERSVNPTPALVDRVCEELFLSKPGQESDDNLAFVRKRLLSDPVHRAEDVLELYGQVLARRPVPDDETDPHCAILRLSGVAKPHPRSGNLVVRNRIYARVFDREWARSALSVAELRRQRLATQRAMTQAGAVAGAAVLMLAAVLVSTWQARERAKAGARAEHERRLEAERRVAEGEAQLKKAATREAALRARSVVYAKHFAPLLPPGDADARLALGRGFARAGDWRNAAAAYTDALRLRPTDADARRGRAEAYRKMGRPREALADCDALPAAAPGRALLRGSLLYEAGQYDRAVADLARAASAGGADGRRAGYLCGLALFDKAQRRGGDLAVYRQARPWLRQYARTAANGDADAEMARGLLAQIAAAERVHGAGSGVYQIEVE